MNPYSSQRDLHVLSLLRSCQFAGRLLSHMYFALVPEHGLRDDNFEVGKRFKMEPARRLYVDDCSIGTSLRQLH